MDSSYPSPMTPIIGSRDSSLNAPISKPSVEPGHISTEELQLFQSPDNLLGKQFDDDSEVYEVIRYSKNRDGTVEYDLFFNDCQDFITVSTEEMKARLEDDLYLPVG